MKFSFNWSTGENSVTKISRDVSKKYSQGCLVALLFSTNTIEPEAKFLPRNRPSVVPEAQPRALREVYFAVETRLMALLYLVFFFIDGALSSIFSSGKSQFVEKDKRL